MKRFARKMEQFNSLNKKGVLIGALVVLLVVAGFLNYEYTRPNGPRTSPTPNAQGSDAQSVGAFFTNFRAQRDQTRTQEVAQLDSIISNEKSTQAKIDEAQGYKLKLTAMMEKEVTLEGMLKAKGFTDAIVTLSDTSVNVVVSEKTLTEAQVAQILELVARETGQEAKNIKIVPLS